MLSLSRCLALFVCLSLVIGCSIDVPDMNSGGTAATVFSDMTVTGLQDYQVIDRNYFTITVTNSQKKYNSFKYAIDKESTYIDGAFDTPTTINVGTEGNHVLFVKGIYPEGTSDAAKQIRFTIKSLHRVADGKFFGDVLVSYANYSGMRISFANYSGLREMDNISGEISITSLGKFSVSGVSVDVEQPPSDVELQLTSAGPESLRASGSGYYHYMNLKHLGSDHLNTAISGDIRLYRSSIETCFVASSSAMHAYSQAGAPDLEAIMTLCTIDNRYYYGHVRLINSSLIKVLTYDVKGDSGPGGLSAASNTIQLSYSNPYGYKVIPSSTTPQTGTGYLTVSSDQTGNYQIDQMSLNFSGSFIYDATPNSITMIKSYARR